MVKKKENSNKIGIIICSIIVVMIVVLGTIIIPNIKKETANNNDAVKFKKEYESLNNTIRESDGARYGSITINEDNPFVYINATEALDILSSKKAIIYIGAAWCPWCRNAVPVMSDVAKGLNIDTIYYLNLDDEKSNFIVENGKLVETNHGSDSYYKLLDSLSKHLKDYVLTDADDNKYDTKEKRIYIPYVITIKNGEILREHLSTIDLNEHQTKYDPLTDDQYKQLYDIYYEMFSELYNSNAICSSSETCN